jgi:hypothetical protein
VFCHAVTAGWDRLVAITVSLAHNLVGNLTCRTIGDDGSFHRGTETATVRSLPFTARSPAASLSVVE